MARMARAFTGPVAASMAGFLVGAAGGSTSQGGSGRSRGAGMGFPARSMQGCTSRAACEARSSAPFCSHSSRSISPRVRGRFPLGPSGSPAPGIGPAPPEVEEGVHQEHQDEDTTNVRRCACRSEPRKGRAKPRAFSVGAGRGRAVGPGSGAGRRLAAPGAMPGACQCLRIGSSRLGPRPRSYGRGPGSTALARRTSGPQGLHGRSDDFHHSPL